MITTAVHHLLLPYLVNLKQRKRTGENGGTRHLLGFLVRWKKMLIKSRCCAKKAFIRRGAAVARGVLPLLTFPSSLMWLWEVSPAEPF